MLPVVGALAAVWPSGVVGCGVLHVVGVLLFGLALHEITFSGIVVLTGIFQPPGLLTHYYGLC
jgi:hypothetical protein